MLARTGARAHQGRPGSCAGAPSASEWPPDRRTDRAEPTFVGRQWEMGALSGLLDRSVNGNGCVVGVVGPPGIGKSRIVREITVACNGCGRRGVRHLLRIAHHRCSISRRRGSAAIDHGFERSRRRGRTDAGTGTVFGGGRRGSVYPGGSAGHRRSRGCVAADRSRRPSAPTGRDGQRRRACPDHADGLRHRGRALDRRDQRVDARGVPTVIPRTRSLVLITYRPEYAGALAHAPRSQTIALEPLDDSQMSQLGTELLGRGQVGHRAR